MTANRFAPVTSRLVWLLPLGIAALPAACGTSASMVGESAGAAGASADHAGASSTSGGSNTASGGSPAGKAGASGSTTSSGGSNTGGSSNGGASSAGAGGSTVGGASSGAGGSGGAACVTDTDCGAGFNCLYKIADGCAAKGSCFEAPGGVTCQSISPYCGCSGQLVGVPCYDPAGYSPAPVSSPQSSTACPPAPDAACASKTCGESCSTGEVPAVCDASGKCIPGGAPTCPATP